MLSAQTFLSSQEAADALGITDSRVRQMLLAGEMSGQKLGKRMWAIPQAEVDRAKKAREATSQGTTRACG